MPTIAPIVEGHGEARSMRGLIQKVVSDQSLGLYCNVDRPFRISRDKFIRDDSYFRNKVETTVRYATQNAALLILLDADDACPAEMGPDLLERARAVVGDRGKVGVVLAMREYESWFLAAADSLAGYSGMSSEVMVRPNPEAVRGAKEWLSSHMPDNSPYSAARHQAGFTERLDWQAARKVSPSCDKLCRVILDLVS